MATCAGKPVAAAKSVLLEAWRDRKAWKTEQRRVAKEVQTLEGEITRLEAEQVRLHALLGEAAASPEDRRTNGQRLKELEDQLTARLAAWEAAGQRLAALDGQETPAASEADMKEN